MFNQKEEIVPETPDYSAGGKYSPIIKPGVPQDPDEKLEEYELMINGLPHIMQLTKADAERYNAKPVKEATAKVVEAPKKATARKTGGATGKAGS